MTQSEVLQIGSRLFKHLGSPEGKAAIYPKQDANGDWFLLVKSSEDLGEDGWFEEVPVLYRRW